jgi:hypothetical protein
MLTVQLEGLKSTSTRNALVYSHSLVVASALSSLGLGWLH